MPAFLRIPPPLTSDQGNALTADNTKPSGAAYESIPGGGGGNITTVTATVSVATYAIDLTKGQRFVLTLATGTVAISIAASSTNAQASNGWEVILIQDNTGGRTVTWSFGPKWAGGVTPTLSAGANKIDDFSFESYDNQATFHGFTEGQDMR